MIEIRCLKDIKRIEKQIQKELADKLLTDLLVIKEFSDEDEEYTLEEFNTNYTGNGYIAILDGSESAEVIEGKLGLTGGLDEVIPESVEIFFIGSDKWSRVIVIYNDSYGMILWLKNYDGFDSYVTDEKLYSFNDLAAPF